MDSYAKMLAQLKKAPALERFAKLYGHREGELARQVTRYTHLVKVHEELFHADHAPLFLVSAPGRTEIAGNHTDHNNGKVLAAAINLDCIACVSPRNDGIIRVISEGFPEITLDLKDLDVHPEENARL